MHKAHKRVQKIDRKYLQQLHICKNQRVNILRSKKYTVKFSKTNMHIKFLQCDYLEHKLKLVITNVQSKNLKKTFKCVSAQR